MSNGDFEIKNYLFAIGLTKAAEANITDIQESEDFAIAYTNTEYNAKYC